MADFPSSGLTETMTSISTAGMQSMLAQYYAVTNGNFSTSAVWPTANLAIFTAVLIESPIVVSRFSTVVTTQSGNLDFGIYSETGARLVSTGTTAVAAAGAQVVTCTPTTLIAGVYFLAMSVNNIVASFQRAQPGSGTMPILGIQTMASAFVLPATATFANPGVNYVPWFTAHGVGVA